MTRAPGGWTARGSTVQVAEELMGLITYGPPKSSMWGHRTGKLAPSEFRTGVAGFLRDAAREWKTRSWSFGMTGGSRRDELRFVNAFRLAHPSAELAGRRGSATVPVREDVFETYLEWFVAHQDLFPHGTTGLNGLYFSLKRRHDIAGWKHPDETGSDAAQSTLTESYGTVQYLGTMLSFTSVPEYRWVAGIARATMRISFSDNHVRPKAALGA